MLVAFWSTCGLQNLTCASDDVNINFDVINFKDMLAIILKAYIVLL